MDKASIPQTGSTTGRSGMAAFIAGLLVGVLLAATGFAMIAGRQQHANGAAGSAPKARRVLMLAHSLPPEHPVHHAMQFMRTRLEELSGGTVTIDIHSGGVLGNETQCLEQVQNGTLAITKVSAAVMEGFVPELAAFSLPYAFRDRDHFWRVLDSPLGKELLLRGADRHLRGLCYYDSGSRNFYTTNRLIRTPDDLKGLKIRVMNSKTAIEMVQMLGGSPTPISWGELFTALQQGVVDGAENNPPSYYTNRHHEVCPFLSMDGHTRIPDIMIVSTRIWQRLPPEVQGWLQQAADDSSEFQRQLWQQKSDEAIASAIAEGVQVIYPDTQPFFEKVQPMLQRLEGTPVGDLLRRFREL